MTDLFAKLLKKRGVGQDFLCPEYKIEPEKLPDIDKALDRIEAAIHKKEKVLIYGDYDADGITSSTLLSDALEQVGLDTAVMLPDRFKDGYGMSMRIVDRALDEGRTLVITVDCGANNAEVVSKLHEVGVETIVTDHHEVMNEIPKDAVAVVDPKRTDVDYREYETLCGCGVAFVLAYGLMQRGHLKEGQEKWLLDLALIGTVCDNMNLSSKINRVICYYGMKVLAVTKRPGLKALMQVSKCTEINSFTLGFLLGPRLNVAGRLKSPDLALKLLMTKSKAEAAKLAAELDKLNQQRKRFQTEVVNEISEQTPEGNVVVVSGKWHEGIVGIVAGRLVEMFHKPAFVLTEVDDGVLKGSGRSFGDFNLAQALSECQDCLLTGGGHAGACGLSLLKKDLPKFKKKIEQHYKGLKLKNQEKYLEVVADVATGNLKDLSVELLDELRQLEPFGEGNPEPVFELDKMRVMATRTVGSDGQHLQITLRDINGATFKTVAFSAPDEWMAIEEMTELNMKVRLSKNEWRGSVSVEGMIQDVTPVE